MLLITGGAGFIGGNYVYNWSQTTDESIIVLDKLTYAGDPLILDSCCKTGQVQLIQGDIGDRTLVHQLLNTYRPRAILHFAAETHVDRSVLDPSEFVQTNVVGTVNLLQVGLAYWKKLPEIEKKQFRFLHVSTDEVFGSLEDSDPPFTESSLYMPNNPYSASKAASDHFVRAYHQTYGFPTLITHCSNNYGPYQFPEKLIPLMILNALEGKSLPVYGDGKNIRDWLYVLDHCEAISQVLDRGTLGEVYNIGGDNEITNIELVTIICKHLDRLKPKSVGSYCQQIQFVADRLGHDRRYAIDARKIYQELGWEPRETIASGIEKTILWYCNNLDWLEKQRGKSYQDWISLNYAERREILV